MAGRDRKSTAIRDFWAIVQQPTTYFSISSTGFELRWR